MGLSSDLVFRTKGQLATGSCDGALAGGTRFGFICGNEVYGNCTSRRSASRPPAPGTPSWSWPPSRLPPTRA